MRRLFLVLAMVLATLAVACRSAAADFQVTDTEAADLARTQLTDWLNGDVRLVVVSADRADFPDAGLGVPFPGELVAQVVTPGYRVILRDTEDGSEHEVRVSGDGQMVRWAPSSVFRGRVGERHLAFTVVGDDGESLGFMPVKGSVIVGDSSPAMGALVEVRYDESGLEPNGQPKLRIPVVTIVLEPAS